MVFVLVCRISRAEQSNLTAKVKKEVDCKYSPDQANDGIDFPRTKRPSPSLK